MKRVSVVLGVLLALAWLPAPGGANSSPHEPEGPKPNRCGCYRDDVGVCMCLRKSRCGCPGECEPLGCEEERQKDLARRMEEEVRKIREDETARSLPNNEDKAAADKRKDEQQSTSE